MSLNYIFYLTDNRVQVLNPVFINVAGQQLWVFILLKLFLTKSS